MDRDAALDGVGHLVAAVHVAGALRHVLDALAGVALPEVSAVVALVRIGRRRGGRGGRRRRRVCRLRRGRRSRRCRILGLGGGCRRGGSGGGVLCHH